MADNRNNLTSLTPPPSPWACEVKAFEAVARLGMERVRAGGWWDEDEDEDEPKREYEVLDGIALIKLKGVMQKERSFWSWFFGYGACTGRTRDQIRAAESDAAVSGILLIVDSPGGSIDGTADLGDAIAAASKVKPVHGYVDGSAQSAAFWVLSQCQQTMCGRTAMVGCIGTYAVLEDWSQAASDAGVKVHVVKAGDLKGAGVFGAPISKDQLAAEQRLVDGLNEHFLAAVATGRRVPLETVRSWATGETYTGDAAHTMGLIDRIGTMDDAMARIKAAAERRKPTTAPWGAGGQSMDVLARIRALANGADDDGNPVTPPAGGGSANQPNNPAPASEAATQVVALNAQVAALNARVEALGGQVAALTTERDALKASADEYAALVRQSAYSECVRALGADRAKAEEERILGAVVMGDDGKPTDARAGGLALSDAKTIRDTYKAAADARFGINATEGATRITTVAALPTLGVHAQDVDGDEDEDTKRIRAKTRKLVGEKA